VRSEMDARRASQAGASVKKLDLSHVHMHMQAPDLRQRAVSGTPNHALSMNRRECPWSLVKGD